MTEMPQFSPFDLQCLNTLAGIANSERINSSTKAEADDIMKSLLHLLKKDVTKLSLQSNGIQLSQ